VKSLRNHRTPYVKSVRALTPDDLQYLREPAQRPSVQRLKDAHFNVCRLLSLGLRYEEVSRRSGYSIGRIYQLASDPAVMERVAEYRKEIDESFREEVDFIQSQTLSNIRVATRQISEHLDEADEKGELLPVRSLMSIISDGCDRFGYQKRSVSVNVNVDFAARLEEAIARTNKARQLEAAE
jgi:uncharacterized protein YdhG (YjbR/CyaY superfamily)